MNICKNILVIIALAGFVHYANAQTTDRSGIDSLETDKDYFQAGDFTGLTNDAGQKSRKFPLKMNYYAGTGFSWSGLYGAAQGMHAGADGSFKINQSFRLSVGSFVRFSRYSNMPGFSASEPGISQSAFNHATMGFYAKGDYLLTPRLTLTGIAFKEYSPYQNKNINPLFLNTNREGVSFQLNYRIKENLHFGARFDYIKNDHPYAIYRNRSVIDNYFW
ncbi:MAG: hypothetical protein R6W78_16030 [Bacteroidales bacterium]